MSSRTPPLVLELRPSRLATRAARGIVACAVAAALTSGQPPLLRVSLVLAVCALVLLARRRERERGCRYVRIEHVDDDGIRVRVRYADGRWLVGSAAGHAVLGHLAVFVFVAREGWWSSPERIVVLRDAVDADGFRRLRARFVSGGGSG